MRTRDSGLKKNIGEVAPSSSTNVTERSLWSHTISRMRSNGASYTVSRPSSATTRTLFASTLKTTSWSSHDESVICSEERVDASAILPWCTRGSFALDAASSSFAAASIIELDDDEIESRRLLADSMLFILSRVVQQQQQVEA